MQNLKATVKLDKRTKDLIKRLSKGDIALIDHKDIDRVSAESLIDKKVAAVINVSSSSTGNYPNAGPLLLASNGILLLDNADKSLFEVLREGDSIEIKGFEIFKDGKRVSGSNIIDESAAEATIDLAKGHMDQVIENFVANTIDYIQKEKGLLFGEGDLPDIKADLQNRPVVIVVRGYHYKEDLAAIAPFILNEKPILIGVDGGADAILDEGHRPHMIIGDMDSVSDKALKCGAELIVHAYEDGKAPGLERLNALGLSSLVFKAPGTSEDIAMLLAYDKGAEIIVAVGTHLNVIEFLDKGRKGMASTFLVRLKVGTSLVDAKGLNLLYPKKIGSMPLVIFAVALSAPIIVILFLSPMAREILLLLSTKLRFIFGL